MIRDFTPNDAAAVASLYNHYIVNTVISFEKDPVTPGEITRRVGDIGPGNPWLICEEEGAVCGYAYGRPWQTRHAYRHTLETSVYVAHDRLGRGVGTGLYAALLERLAGLDVHALVGGIALPNPASVRLHEKFGFKQVALYPAVGRKFNRWLDVGYWHRLINDTDPA